MCIKDMEPDCCEGLLTNCTGTWLKEEAIMEYVDNLALRLGRRYLVFWTDDKIEIKEIMCKRK